MVKSFEGVVQRIRWLWMATLGCRIGRCNTTTTADSGEGSGKAKPRRGPLAKSATRARIAAGRKTGGR